MTWIITIISMVGTILNVKKMICCFYVWTIANIMWLLYDMSTGMISRALLDVTQLIFGIWGIYEWKSMESGLNDRES